MSKKCCIVDCGNFNDHFGSSATKISFHRLPSCESIRNCWIKAITNQNGFEPPKHGYVCSRHFNKESFFPPTNQNKNKLRQWAVPTIFPKNANHLGTNVFVKTSVLVPFENYSIADISTQCQTSDVSTGDFNYCIEDTTSVCTPNEHIYNYASECVGSVTETTIQCPVSDVETGDFDYCMEDTTSVLSPKLNENTNQNITLVARKKYIRKKIRYPLDIKIDEYRTQKNFQSALKKLKTALADERRKNRSLKQKLYRRENKISSMASLIDVLKNKSLISENAATHFLKNAESKTDLFDKVKAGKIGGSYSKEVRSFAITVHFYSPRAYDYLRKVFGNKLPHHRTIQKWYESIDGKPGCTSEALTVLKIYSEESKKRKQQLVCNLVMDEMAIRKQLEYNSAQQKYFGYCDIGNPFEEEEERIEAKEALVFLIVAANATFKIPVAYFLVNGLNATEKSNIVLHVLKFLNQVDVKIASFIFDGAPSNMATARKLGACFESEAIYFKHPITLAPIYVILDICHMLKLIRNTFAHNQILYDENNKEINWKFIEQLEKSQSSEGVLLANKLKSKHINFDNLKMKTSIAAQTLSHSVAAALMYQKSTGNTNFSNFDETVKFILTFNNLFDILNSNKYGTRYKRPLSDKTKTEFLNYFDTCIKYIESLKIIDKGGKMVTILSSKSKTGYLGFLTAMKSFKLIYEMYVGSNQMKYISCYKFSQDHLETFFSAIRARGGWNNNPNCMQFTAAYKRLLVHNEIKASENSNCLVEHKESSSQILKPITDKALDYLKLLDEESQSVEEIVLTGIVHDTVTYIAGFVERSFHQHIKCNTCLQCLAQLDTYKQIELIKCKDWGGPGGGLVKPKEDIVKLCQIAENEISLFELENKLANSNFYHELISNCLSKVNKEIFKSFYSENAEHAMNCPYDRQHLVKYCLDKYLKIKLSHMGKVKSENMCKKKIRQKYNKLILFSGQ